MAKKAFSKLVTELSEFLAATSEDSATPQSSEGEPINARMQTVLLTLLRSCMNAETGEGEVHLCHMLALGAPTHNLLIKVSPPDSARFPPVCLQLIEEGAAHVPHKARW